MHFRRFVPLIAVTALTLALLGASPVSAGGLTTSLAPPSDPDTTGTATVWINPGMARSATAGP